MSKSTGILNLPHGVGRAGEAAARSYLVNKLAYEIGQNNYRTPEGEIDIVAKSGDVLVFVEVKTRTNRNFGLASEQISSRKAMRLQNTALRYMGQFQLVGLDWRIDLLSVEMTHSGQVSGIEHIQNAIEAQG